MIYCHWTIWWNLHQPLKYKSSSRNTVPSGDWDFLLWKWTCWLYLYIPSTKVSTYSVTVKAWELNQGSPHNSRWKPYRNICIFNTMCVESSYFPAKSQAQDFVSLHQESETSQSAVWESIVLNYKGCVRLQGKDWKPWQVIKRGNDFQIQYSVLKCNCFFLLDAKNFWRMQYPLTNCICALRKETGLLFSSQHELFIY